MPPKAKQKQDESKKSTQKKKQQRIEDMTFGLKNKNKSKVVQRKIQGIEKNVINSGDPKMRRLEELRVKQKAEAKARKKAMEDERNALFGEALLALQKKSKSTTSQKEGKIEAKGRDAEDDAKKPAQSRAMKMMYQMDAQEMEERLREDPNYVPTLEDEIENQRQKLVAELKASGKPGTPVTPESFAAWQEAKRKKKAEAAKKLVEAELKKKKGKGLAVLSGRDLYEYKRDLFVDDEDGAEESNFGDDDDDENGDENDMQEDEDNDDMQEDDDDNEELAKLSDAVEQSLSVEQQELFDGDVDLPED